MTIVKDILAKRKIEKILNAKGAEGKSDSPEALSHVASASQTAKQYDYDIVLKQLVDAGLNGVGWGRNTEQGRKFVPVLESIAQELIAKANAEVPFTSNAMDGLNPIEKKQRTMETLAKKIWKAVEHSSEQHLCKRIAYAMMEKTEELFPAKAQSRGR